MQMMTTIGQQWGTRWKQAVRVALTIGLVSAVAVAGFALLGSEVLASWTSPAQSLASSGNLDGVLNFEAPAATVARFDAKSAEASKGQASTAPLLAKNWKYTDNSLQNSPLLPYLIAFDYSWAAYIQGSIIFGFEEMIDALPLPSATQQLFDQLAFSIYSLDVAVQKANNAILPPELQSPPLVPLSPSF